MIPLHTRGPDSIVQSVQANTLPLARLLLGVGSPNPGALGRVRAGVAELQSQLRVRLIVAALGPQMCRLAGEVAVGSAACGRLAQEGARYAAITAYAAPFARMGVKPMETTAAVQTAGAIPAALGRASSMRSSSAPSPARTRPPKMWRFSGLRSPRETGGTP